MTTFEKHVSENEVSAKTALVSLAAQVIGKYVCAQSYMNSVLAGGSSLDPKSQECLMCRLDKITRTMSKFEGQVGQIAKSYEMMFGEQLDVKFITAQAVAEFYPAFKGTSVEFDAESVVARVFSEGWEANGTANPSPSNGGTVEGSWPGSNSTTWRPGSDMSHSSRSGSKGSSPIQFPEGTPDEVKDITNIIKSTLAKYGKNNVDIKVFDVKNGESFYGVDPTDFDNPEDFQRAVVAARKSFKNSESCPSGKGEEFIKENIIHAAEEAASHPETHSTSTETPTGSSKPSSKKSDLN